MLKPGLCYDFDTEKKSIQIMEYAIIGFFSSDLYQLFLKLLFFVFNVVFYPTL